MESNYFGQARKGVDEASSCLDDAEISIQTARDLITDAYQLICKAEDGSNRLFGMSPESRKSYSGILQDLAALIDK